MYICLLSKDNVILFFFSLRALRHLGMWASRICRIKCIGNPWRKASSSRLWLWESPVSESLPWWTVYFSRICIPSE